MNRSILLDTNAYSDLRRSGKWLSATESASEVYLSVIVIGELRAGFMSGGKRERNELDLQRFLSKPTARVVAPNLQTTLYYSQLHLQLRLQGTPIPANDLWIAAIALQHQFWLCTSDAHFDHIPQLLRAQP
ncbi:type II toxin-antitoxin system VapC family toxin [Luteolibacter sp. SL250]|uniref:type II toxin-antitoxin system VapC family toxin n=1 Tax=Luteolibacter sp. SL250 TaxID=2995170 RepID=UPI002270878F|nr:type II toxin-antitoxin system VapC family toxin [Luteolibacter sp. SL250]WAC18640.1 type II toxin-antitoxin system VapC family toxin [Luteolibacter sp. SL250]